MAQKHLFSSLLSIAMLCASAFAAAQVGEGRRPAEPAAACAGIARGGSEIARRYATILDAPTTIISATLIPAGGNGNVVQKEYPEYCRVEGMIQPTVGFELRMPTKTWNGKFLMGGCGGPCGLYLTDRIDHALVRNYTVVVTDMGHKGWGWIFANTNIQNMIDFGYRSTHVTVLAAKELIRDFYGVPASRNYYSGCSMGGRQGLVEAQRFPEDLDGIIAGAPPWKQTGHYPYVNLWPTQANMKGGKPILDRAKLPMLHAAVLARCDANDGLKDRILQNPMACDFQPSQIVCETGTDPSTCLTTDEAAVVAKIYQGPVNSKGQMLHRGQARGSELKWNSLLGNNGVPGEAYDTADSTSHHLAYLPAPAPGYRLKEFDFDRDPPRLAANDWMFNHTNPDLSRFKANGGKLILYHGWNDDNLIPPELAIDYYQMAERTMGGPANMREFARLFMMPGMDHCRGGIGGGEADWISALENWVEKGQAPEEVIVHHMAAPYPTAEGKLRLGRFPLQPGEYNPRRPVYVYPDVAQYKGSGDPAQPENWIRKTP